MLNAQSAMYYAQVPYFREVGHSTKKFPPVVRYAFIQYEPYDLIAEIYKVICLDSHVAENS
jgi:hypothetical protein